MSNSKPLSQRRALRALAEGARPTLELLADASGRSPRTLALEAERDGWALDGAPRENVGERVRVIAGMLLERVEAVGRTALEEGGKINKAEIDGILTIIKGLEKIDEITRSEEAAKEKQVRQDEDLANVLQRINARIVELAKAFAAQLGEQPDRPGRSGARAG